MRLLANTQYVCAVDTIIPYLIVLLSEVPWHQDICRVTILSGA